MKLWLLDAYLKDVILLTHLFRNIALTFQFDKIKALPLMLFFETYDKNNEKEKRKLHLE